jgi:hypothetical protein
MRQMAKENGPDAPCPDCVCPLVRRTLAVVAASASSPPSFNIGGVPFPRVAPGLWGLTA